MKKLLLLPLAVLPLAAACASPEKEETPEPTAAPPAEVAPQAEILGSGTVSTAAPEFATSVHAGGTELYFNRANADRSELVVLVSRQVDGVWGEAEAVSFSTGEYRDVDPFITADGARLFFSSNRPDASLPEGYPVCPTK